MVQVLGGCVLVISNSRTVFQLMAHVQPSYQAFRYDYHQSSLDARYQPLKYSGCVGPQCLNPGGKYQEKQRKKPCT